MQKKKTLLLSVVIVLVVIPLLTWVQYSLFTRSFSYANQDFMTLWAGGRALIEGVDPYDAAAWQPLRARYGSTWMPDSIAPFPIWMFMLMLPFSLLNVELAAAAWVTISEVLLGACVFGLLSFEETPKLSLGSFALLSVALFGFRATVITLVNGQVTILMLAIIVGYLLLLKTRRPFWAGVLLPLLVLKPNPVLFFVPLTGIWLLAQRRWKVILGGAAGAAGMLLIGELTLPGWLPEWLHASDKASVAWRTPTVWGLAGDISLSQWMWIGLLLMLLVIVPVSWIAICRKDLSPEQVTALAIPASLLVTPYAWAYEHLLLFIPLLLLFPRFNQSWGKRALWFGLVLILPWLLFWVATRRGWDTFSFLMPLIVGASYYWLAIYRPQKPTVVTSDSV